VIAGAQPARPRKVSAQGLIDQVTGRPRSSTREEVGHSTAGPPGTGEPAYKASDSPPSPYRDVGFLALWLVGVVAVFGILAGYGSQLAAEATVYAAQGGSGRVRTLDIGFFVGTLCACILLTALFAFLYLELMIRSAEKLVTFTLYGSLVGSFLLMVIAFVTAGAFGILFLVVFLLNCWYAAAPAAGGVGAAAAAAAAAPAAGGGGAAPAPAAAAAPAPAAAAAAAAAECPCLCPLLNCWCSPAAASADCASLSCLAIH
jgi:hypothetical protein